MSGAKSNYLAWIAKADHDFLNIQNNLNGPNVPWDTVCFHAQQAAEKLLKAFLVYHGQPFLRTHDLVAILAGCVAIEPSLSALEDDCRRLTYYAVTARYPDDLYEPAETDGREMLVAASRVRRAILVLLPESGRTPPGEAAKGR